MARGQQKIQSQQKNAEKQAKKKKAAAGDQKKAAAKALKVICASCRLAMMSQSDYKAHWDSKHSKLPLPAELK